MNSAHQRPGRAGHTGPVHPGMKAEVEAGARRADVPAGDAYKGVGQYDATGANIGLYAAVGIIALVLAAAVLWVFVGR